MNWEQFQLWHNYLLNTQYKDNLIDNTIGEFSRVLIDHKNGFSNFNQGKEDLSKIEWNIFGKININLNKIKLKYNINLDLPRKTCKNSQKSKKSTDVSIGMMYNIPAEQNGIDTETDYFYIPIHKTRRHIHGVPSDFIYTYLINMIDTSQWDKINYTYYFNMYKHVYNLAIYECPEKYCIQNIQKKNKKSTIEKLIKCNKKIQLYAKIIELKKYLPIEDYNKIIKYYNKKLVDNFRINFPKKIKYVTYCIGNCIHSNGYIHNGIPSGIQKCHECDITYCRECNKSPYHHNELCDFTDEITFEDPENYRKCPSCGFWIMKIEGCSHMKCNCGVHFCYDCRGVLCANDPYYHICRMDNADPHYRDFRLNDISVQQDGEVACNCSCCLY